jgi:predicted phosphoribosyltransferase
VPQHFSDREHAGRRLAPAVAAALAGTATPPVVLALPRGGVPVAAPVAAALQAPLDVIVVRKLGQPGRPELGVGALAEDGQPLWNTGLLRELGLTPDALADVVVAEAAEVRRRVERYRGGRAPVPLTGRTAIVVDDGLATGLTALAAVQRVRAAGAARVVLAVPVAAADTAALLRRAADDVVCLLEPGRLRSVGEWYLDFSQVPDDTVTGLLATFDG